MALVEWNDSYSVGIVYLDNQHKGLVAQINALHDAMSLGKARKVLSPILDTLIDYTATHFSSEEELFAKYNYPEKEDHIAEHQRFVDDVLIFKEHYESGRALVSFEILAFLKNWIVGHMLGSDQKYKAFLESEEVLVLSNNNNIE